MIKQIKFMKSITFHCEVITPMFLAGADGRSPELRPPSIKGALRFWWRALNANLVKPKGDGKWDYSELKKKETEIFGGGGENARKSRVEIEVIGNLTEEDIVKYPPLPHKNKGEKGFFKKEAIKPGYKFVVKLTLQENKFITLEQIEKLFIIFSLLGGLGNRSRRGFGSFRIIKINNVEFKQPDSIEEIENYIKSINSSYPFTNISPNYPFVKTIKIGERPSTLSAIGSVTHNKKGLYGGYKNEFKYENSIGNSNPRFSSPIYMSMVKKNDNNLYPIITILNTLPPNNRSFDENLQTEFINAILQ